MVKNIGRLVNVWVGRETTRGTVVSINTWIPKATLDFELKSEKVMDASAIGVIEDAFEWHVVKQWAEWPLWCHVYANAIGFLLYALFGSLTTTGAWPSYSHAFSVAQTNQHQSLTIGLADGTQDRRFALAVLDTLELSSSIGGFVDITATFKSLQPADATLTPSYSTDYALMGKHTKFKVASNLAGLWAASYISVKSLSLTFNKNLEEDTVLGNVAPADFCNTFFSVEGNVELLFEDETYLDIYNDGTEKAIRIEIEDTSNAIDTGIYPKLTIDLAKVIMTEFAKGQENDSLLKQGLTFRWLFSMSDNSMVTATLINSKVSY